MTKHDTMDHSKYYLKFIAKIKDTRNGILYGFSAYHLSIH